MADRLGTTEFWTARVASHLIRKDLVELRPDADVEEFESTEPAYEEATHEEVAHEDAPVVESVEEATAEEWSFNQPAADVDEADVDPDESWWQEPEAEEGSEVEESSEDQDVADYMPVAEGQSADERVEEPVSSGSEEFSQIPTLTAEATEADTAEVEEDTEAFLEKVFSELESPEEPAEEGYGLLRRRRMGAIRDLSGDS